MKENLREYELEKSRIESDYIHEIMCTRRIATLISAILMITLSISIISSYIYTKNKKEEFYSKNRYEFIISKSEIINVGDIPYIDISKYGSLRTLAIDSDIKEVRRGTKFYYNMNELDDRLIEDGLFKVVDENFIRYEIINDVTNTKYLYGDINSDSKRLLVSLFLITILYPILSKFIELLLDYIKRKEMRDKLFELNQKYKLNLN